MKETGEEGAEVGRGEGKGDGAGEGGGEKEKEKEKHGMLGEVPEADSRTEAGEMEEETGFERARDPRSPASPRHESRGDLEKGGEGAGYSVMIG